jgi:hypothetical protein
MQNLNYKFINTKEAPQVTGMFEAWVENNQKEEMR